MHILKQTIYLVLFLSCNLGASSRGVEMVEPPSVTTRFFGLSEYRPLPGSRSSCDDCLSKSVDICESKLVQVIVALTVFTGIVLVLSPDLADPPYTYKVYNRCSDAVTVTYRPGCLGNDEDGSQYEVDCTKYLAPGKHVVIDSCENLTKLCAQDDSWNFYWSGCTTRKGLEDSYVWNVHNHNDESLYFGRGKYSSSKSGNSTSIRKLQKRNLRRIVEK